MREEILQIFLAFSSKEYVDTCLQDLSKVILYLVGHGQLEDRSKIFLNSYHLVTMTFSDLTGILKMKSKLSINAL